MSSATRLAFAMALISMLATSSWAAESGRVIVKYRSDVPLRQAAGVGMVQTLALRSGLALRSTSGPAEGTAVIHSRGIDSAALAKRLAREPEIAYAVPDHSRQIRAVPNDELFSRQWYLQTTEPAAINMTGAWDRSQGGNGTIVAVIDTGMRPEHPDLAGKIVGGFDFIADLALAADGNGRDADFSDPGDFIDAASRADAALVETCGQSLLASDRNSSWHGTRVGGLIAAATNNAMGIAGGGWNLRLLGLRALGKCGGFDSDIIAAMRWAAGLPVPGVAENANPAKVINLSLGGAGQCEQSYLDAIRDITARGALIVAAAGNANGDVETPGNCPGVLAVGGLRHVGTKVGYSSLGPEVGISAPAGNCVNEAGAGPCLYELTTTTNGGKTSPAESSYSSTAAGNIGTSFSAPLVAATAGLMFDTNEALTPARVTSRMKSAARAFPRDAALLDCPATNTDQQCNCTTSTCGAGMLDAAGALAAVALPAATISTRDALIAGTVRLDAGGSQAASGRVITAWSWSLASAPTGARIDGSGSQVSLVAPVAGDYRVRLQVTEDGGDAAVSYTTLSITAAASSAPPAAGGGSGGGGTVDFGLGLGLLLLAGIGYFQRSRQSNSAAARLPPR